MLVGVVHAGHEAELIVDVGGIGHAVDHGHLAGLGLQRGGDSGEEATLLLGEGHGVHVIQGNGVAFGVGDGGVHHQEVGVRVGGGHVAAGGEVEAGQNEYVIAAGHTLHGGNQLVVIRFLDVADSAVGMVGDKGLDALVAVLVEGAVVNAGGGDNADFQLGVRSAAVTAVAAAAVVIGVVLAAAGSQGQDHGQGQEQCREFLCSFHQFFLLMLFWQGL